MARMPGERKPLLAGNWKMNGLAADLAEVAAVRDGIANWKGAAPDTVLCLPATLLMAAGKLCAGSALALGGQDCHEKAGGAHTGDLAAEMLKDAGAAYVIVGHSERRADHGESDALVRAKAEAGFRAGLSVILCVGETQSEREAGVALPKVGAELAGSLPQELPVERLAIAYEPVWAIGTGLTPTPLDVAEMHDFLRSELRRHIGDRADVVRLLYGGSVKPANAVELLHVSNVDGTLVGGCSLKAADFLAIGAVYVP